MNEEVTGRLENWYVANGVVWGNLHDDVRKRWDDGEHIRTSTVQGSTTNLKEGEVVKTRNSLYLLGKKAGLKSKEV